MPFVCSNCGHPLSQTAKFCRQCGAPATPVCTGCGAHLSQNAQFCRQCGAPRAAEAAETQNAGSLNKVVTPQPDKAQAPQQPAQPVLAPKAQQDVPEPLPSMSFDFAPPPVLSDLKNAAASVAEAIGPIKLLLGGFMQLVRGFKGAVKDKKKLIPALIFATVWMALTLLPALGITLPGGKFLSWLTFAQGGTRGGVPGFLGGVFGKGLLASALMGLFSRKNGLKKRGGVFGEITRLLPAGRREIAVLTAGVGLALFGYNLMTGDNSLQNSMIGIVAAASSLRSITAQASFLRRLIAAVAQKLTKGRGVSVITLNRFTVGMAAGFAAAVPFSAIGIPWLGYALGAAVCITGAMVALTDRPAQPKGVAV